MLLQGVYAVAFIYPQGKVLIIMVCVRVYMCIIIIILLW